LSSNGTLSAAPTPEPALAGITVLELTRDIPGGYCGRLLAMLGATVIKVESVRRPDRSRALGPFPGDAPGFDNSGLYRYLHAQKKSLALDVSTASGFALLKALAHSADVLIDDGALGDPSAAAPRYQQLLGTNPRLVVNALSSNGLEGPRAGWASSELTELAAAGWLRQRGDGSEPYMPGAPMAHYGAGIYAALGILLALTARRRHGSGQLVETPLNEALLSLLAFPTAGAAFTGSDGIRLGDGFPFAIYPCADGHLGVSILTQRHWQGLCRLMGRDDLLTDPRFLTGTERAQPAVVAEINEIIGGWIADKLAQPTFQQAQEMRVPITIIPSPGQVLQSPHYAAREYWVEYDDAAFGPLRLPGQPFKFTHGGFAPFEAAHSFGADTAAVLDGLEMPFETRRALASAGVLQ
jgi:CoA:oxalate CoA-transferase